MTGEGVDALFNRLAEDLASQPEPETFSRVCIVPYSQYVNRPSHPSFFLSLSLSCSSPSTLCRPACSEKNACCCSIMAPPPPNVVSRLFASLPDQYAAPLFPSHRQLWMLRVRGTDWVLLKNRGVPQRRGNDVIAGSVPMMSKQRGTTRLVDYQTKLLSSRN